jgi:hypothetical protein
MRNQVCADSGVALKGIEESVQKQQSEETNSLVGSSWQWQSRRGVPAKC